MSEGNGGASIYGHMARGAAWAIAMRWSIRLIGLVSVVILARLLTPEDFGIVALAVVSIGLIRELSELGTGLLLIRTPDPDRDECDTAWTLRVLQGALVAFVIAGSAPLATYYFDDPRIVPVLYVLALSALIQGFENIGMILVQKDLDFAKDFRFNVWRRLTILAITIAVALSLRNYWALVVGEVVGGVLAVGISYLMHSYRPRFSLKHCRKYLTFSVSIIPLNVARYLHQKVDVLIVGGLAPTSLFGAYSVAADLAGMVTREAVMPLGRVLFPSYAKIAGDPATLSSAFRNVVAAATTVCLPLGVGLSVTADDFVHLVLGNQWEEAVTFVRWLALYAMLSSLLHLMSVQILVIGERERRAAVLTWIRLLLLVPAALVAGLIAGPAWIPIAATGAVLVAFPIIIFQVSRVIPVTPAQILLSIWRPVLAAAAMWVAVNYSGIVVPGPTILSFAVDVALGAATFFVSLWLLWHIAGRPGGVESGFFNAVRRIRLPRAG